jgi:hypothetical protein
MIRGIAWVGRKTRCRLPASSAPLPLAFECRLALRRGRNVVPAFDRDNEIHDRT